MDIKILDLLLGPEAEVKAEFKDGKLQLEIVYEGAQLGGSASVVVKGKAALDKIKELIPGKIDDMILDLAEKALGL